jgi:hypothetical protein
MSSPTPLLVATSCPWNNNNNTNNNIKTNQIQFTSLSDVMSEQLAIDLHQKEMIANGLANDILSPPPLLQTELIDNQQINDDNSIDNDFILAQLLQLELDKEADEQLEMNEKIRNKNSRSSILLTNSIFI